MINLLKPFRHLHKTYRILQNQVQSHLLAHLSEQEKREYLAYWARRTGYRIFVETGTYMGKTAIHMSSICRTCHTIEVSEKLYAAAKETLRPYGNISLHHGDSGAVLPAILAGIDEPALFWLDAHHSGGKTGGAKRTTPIRPELEAIFAHPVKTHVILIDDARAFLGLKGYPTIKAMERLVRKAGGGYKMIINNDIIVIYHEDI